MTDEHDNLNDEDFTSEQSHTHQAEVSDDEFSDEDDVQEENEFDVDTSELSPNEIFGLDPLDVLTLEELADYLKVSPAAARRAIKDQNLPGRNIGGEWRFLRDAVANWLRGQEAPAVQQQQARDSYQQAKPGFGASEEAGASQYTRPPRKPYQSEQPERKEYRSRQRFSEGQYPYGGQGGAYRGGQYGDQPQYEGADEGPTDENQSRPPRRPFRSYEARGEGNSQGYSGYGGGGGGFTGGQRFGGGPKKPNKRRVFEKQRGNRMDRRRDSGASEGQ